MSQTPLTDALIQKHADQTASLEPEFRTLAHAHRQVVEFVELTKRLERDRADLLKALKAVCQLRYAARAAIGKATGET